MRSSVYLLMVLCVCMLFNASCSKTDTPLIPPVDSLTSLLPKQIISIESDPNSPNSIVISIKYDTANLKIDLYQDDTTNTNPYDVLAGTYTYNTSGYLVSINDFAGDQTVQVQRASNNNIIWIRRNAPSDEDLDTTFYQYRQAGANTIISTTANSYNAGVLISSQNETDTYNAAFKLVNVAGAFGYLDTLIYNANGSLSKSIATDGVDNYQDTYTYNAGIADGTGDPVLNVFMGKDAYIGGIREYYPISLLNNMPALSGTDPYHVTRLLSTKNGATNEDRAYVYQLNAQNLLSKITITSSGVQGPTTYEFRY